MNCPNCGFGNPAGLKFCGMCGTRLAMICPACNFMNPPEFQYCGMCGTVLGDSVNRIPPAPVIATSTLASMPTPESVPPPTKISQLEGERRVVTVIVADVTGSTNLLEQLGNESWVEMMNRVLLALEAEIYRYGGVVDQFRGDGLVAFFGSDISNEDDPERAVLAALAMQQAIEKQNLSLPASVKSGIKLRVGVNTGEVIVASIGDKKQHREDTAMGIAIAVAARLESAAVPGTVLASESTKQQTESQFNWEPLGEILVKGLTFPLAVYRPTSSRSDTDRTINLEIFGYTIPLVGREMELSRIEQHVDILKLGQGSLVLLSGETGIGKQALIREVRQFFLRQGSLLADAQGQEAPTEEQFLWLYGRCRSYNRNWPYSLWIELLNNWLDVYSGQHHEEVQQRLLDRTQELWGESYHQYYPYLAELLRLPIEEEYREKIEYLSAESLRNQISTTIKAWLEALAVKKPTVVVLSEIEWSDPSSLQLLKSTVSVIERLPILFLLLYRDENNSLVSEAINGILEMEAGLAEQLTLAPLSDEHINQLIDYLIGPDIFPIETRGLFVRNSEGNPSYIVEILRSLIDKEVLVQDCDSNRWCLSRPVEASDLQGNLTRLLQARIDRLTPLERQTLQMAAVVGPIFWSQILQAVIGDQVLINEPLNSLVKAQLIERRGRNPEMGWEYNFRTDLIHGVVYESLLNSQRETYHLRIAQTLEETYPSESGIEHQGLIAYHYRRANEPRKELFYANWAAEKAIEVYAVEEAIEHYSRALVLLDELEAKTKNAKQLRALQTQRFEVLTGRLTAKYQRGDVKSGMQDARALLDLARAMEDEPTWLIDALLKQPEVEVSDTREQLDEGLNMADQALVISRQLGDKHRELFSLIAKAHLLHIRGDTQGVVLGMEALELARQLEDMDTQVTLLLGLSQAYGMEDVKRESDYLKMALALRDKIHNKWIQRELIAATGIEKERNGDYYNLLTEHLAKQVEICRDIGDRIAEGYYLMTYAQVEGLYLGD
jgi:class 3 adenylate cyclase